MKTCRACNADKPLDQFGIHGTSVDGRRGTCNACRSQRESERYASSREEGKQYRRDYYAANKELVSQQQREYRERNRGAIAQRKRDYHERNRDTIIAKVQTWYRANKPRAYEIVRRSGIRRRAAVALQDQHTNEEWQAVLKRSGGRCIQCGSTDRLARDHIVPLSKGGSDRIENIQPLCKSCNSRKGARLSVS